MTEEFRPAVATAQTVMLVQGSIGLSVLAIVLTVQLISFKEKFRKLEIRKRTDRNIFYLLALTLFAMAFYCDEIAMYGMNWTGRDAACSPTGRPVYPFFFVVAKQFLYFFLYERASIVLDALKMQHRAFNYIRYGVAFAILIGIP